MPDSPVWPPPSRPSCLTLSEVVIPFDDLRDFWWVSCGMARLQYDTKTEKLNPLSRVQQWRSQEGARGATAPPQTLRLTPKQIHLKINIFWLHLRLMYPRMSEYKPQFFLLASLAALFCTLIFIVALSVTVTISWVRCPLKILVAPNRHSLATCLGCTHVTYNRQTDGFAISQT